MSVQVGFHWGSLHSINSHQNKYLNLCVAVFRNQHFQYKLLYWMQQLLAIPSGAMISSGLANKAHFSVVQRLRRKTQDVTVSVFSLVNSTIPSVPVLSVINYASQSRQNIYWIEYHYWLSFLVVFIPVQSLVAWFLIGYRTDMYPTRQCGKACGPSNSVKVQETLPDWIPSFNYHCQLDLSCDSCIQLLTSPSVKLIGCHESADETSVREAMCLLASCAICQQQRDTTGL